MLPELPFMAHFLCFLVSAACAKILTESLEDLVLGGGVNNVGFSCFIINRCGRSLVLVLNLPVKVFPRIRSVALQVLLSGLSFGGTLTPKTSLDNILSELREALKESNTVQVALDTINELRIVMEIDPFPPKLREATQVIL